MSYIQLTTPLVLHADPVLPDHAVTKRYVDGKKAFLQASWFTSGVVSALRMPALSGDVSSAAGSGVVALSDSGVAAGSYTKVTVNSSGRVTAGGYLAVVDVPSVDWSKVTTGKPTTAAGYGITNLIALSGGTASGYIASSATATDNLHAVTKTYVDDNVTGVVSASLLPGDVVRKATTVTPSGFLRCNGGMVSKTDYAALYTVIYSEGKLVTLEYTDYAAVGAGKPWVQQYDFNRSFLDDLKGWTTAAPLPSTVAYAQVVTTQNRVYLLGGAVANSPSSAIHTAPIGADGAIGTWTMTSNLPAASTYSQAVVTKNRIHLLAGSGSTTTYSAPINSDGTLGNWTNSGSLPSALYHSQAVVTKNRIYLLGGSVGSSSSSIVYTALINADGTIGTWTTGTALPVAVSQAQVVVTQNRVYLLGGYTTTETSAVYTAPINSDGTLGAWVADTALPEALRYSQAIVARNRVFLLGGYKNTGVSVVYSAPLNPDGTLGAWSTSTPLPVAIYQAQAIVTQSKVYLIGGAGVATVYTASLPGGLNDYSYLYDGSINKFNGTNVTGDVVIEGHVADNFLTPGAGRPWEQQYLMAGNQSGNITGTVDSTGFPVAISGSQPVVTKNKVYLLGGKIGTDDTGTIYTANINTDGTLTAWTDNATYVSSSFSGSGSTTIPGDARQIAVTASGSSGYSYGGEMIDPGHPGTPARPDIPPVYETVTTTTLVSPATPGQPYIPPTYDPRPSNGPPPVIDPGQPYIAPTPAVYVTSTEQVLVTPAIPGHPGTPYVPPTYAPGGYVSGTASTFTVAGTTLTFPADAGSSTKYVTIPASASAYPATYSIATGSAVVKYTNYTTSLANSTVLPVKVSHHNVAVTKNRVYLVGGNKEATVTTSVYSAPIDASGNIGAWASETALPGNANYDYSCVAITRGHLFVFGGKAVAGGAASSAVYSASINADGTLGAWVTATALPSTVYGGACFTTYNRIYLIAGYAAGSTSTTVYTALINPDGTLGAWSTTIPLPTHAAYGKVYVSNNTVYVFGANNTTTMYYSDIGANGVIGPWKTGTASPYAPVNAALFVVKNKLYMVGGAASSGTSRNVATYSIANTLNDYSPYYNGSILPISLTSFRLPDFSAKETDGINFYIKY